MKKRIIALFVVVLLIASLLVPAVAEARGCGNSQSNANYKLVTSMVRAANSRIDALVLVAKLTPYDDVNWLLRQVNSISRTTIRSAKALGYVVECRYVTHYIDGRYVEIDPLYVVNPLPNNGGGSGGH